MTFVISSTQAVRAPLQHSGIKSSIVRFLSESDIPKVTVSNLTVDHSVSATIFCNITFRGSQTTTLKSLWLSKDGKNLNDTLKEDGISESTSLVLKNISMKDGGMYSCNLKVLLKDKVPREIKETSSLTSKCFVSYYVTYGFISSSSFTRQFFNLHPSIVQWLHLTESPLNFHTPKKRQPKLF